MLLQSTAGNRSFRCDSVRRRSHGCTPKCSRHSSHATNGGTPAADAPVRAARTPSTPSCGSISSGPDVAGPPPNAPMAVSTARVRGDTTTSSSVRVSGLGCAAM